MHFFRVFSVSFLLAIAFTVTGCATYKISHVTSHGEKLYLTTDKETKLFWFWLISSEQAITECKRVPNEQPTLECKEVQVVIDGSEWDQ